ncbi:unnamed protein product [Rodentolepis nana]|uniref:Reverse transcriptase domain-containing protein n=1 Tax=Rodentolepis nana TaxID=102285 RepID=A0A0R3TI34_RODNA|nr:unnamed protein product [Rodentolepis nana]
MGLQGYKHSWKENRRHANSNEDPASLNALSKSNPLQTGLSQGVTSCTLFNVFINYVAELVQTVTGIKYLLYADDHVPWNSAPKKNAKERTDSAIIGVEWLSTPRKLHSKPILWPDSINPLLRYKDTTLGYYPRKNQ